MMVGREPSEFAKREHLEPGEEALRVEGITRAGVLRDISLTVRKGEVVGLAGLVGAGRSELARAIIGADPMDAGRVILNGQEVRIRTPEDAARVGIAYVPEDRKGQGLVLGMPIEANITLPILTKLTRWGLLRTRRRREVAQKLVNDVQMRPPDVRRLAMQLSGGNQQKVVLGKWLGDNASVFILDEPTRGIDVGAKVEIYTPDRPPGPRRRRHPAHLLGAPRDPRPERPRCGDAPGPHRRPMLARGGDGRAYRAGGDGRIACMSSPV